MHYQIAIRIVVIRLVNTVTLPSGNRARNNIWRQIGERMKRRGALLRLRKYM